MRLGRDRLPITSTGPWKSTRPVFVPIASFEHEDAPFRMKVIKRHATGGYSLDIQIKD